MIKVTYQPERYRLEMSGHAGAGPAGQDLVCCAASALSYALEAHMMLHEDEFRAEIFRTEIGAEFLAAAHPKILAGPRCKAAFDCIADGLQLLSEQYPDNISFERVVSDED